MRRSRTFVFYVETMRIVLGATAPGLDWTTVLEQAIRQYYADATQGKWVKVLLKTPVELTRRYERWSVLTSRYEVLSVVVRELTHAELEDEIEDDPPEVLVVLEHRRSARAMLEQARVAAELKELAGA